jgi:heme/copper-type cytochrome/quinol oxidase subunit 2
VRRDPLRTGLAALLVISIMVLGSLVLWVGTPVLWLWVGSQVQGATQSLGEALGTAFVGAVVTIGVLAALLSKLSNVYRSNTVARGRDDPGHVVLEGVLVVSAAIALAVFAVWFFLFAGAAPIPIGINA